MQYILGATLFEKYGGLLNKSYSAIQLYTRAQSLNRTIVSAYAHTYGMYNGMGPGLNKSSLSQLATPPYAD